MGNKVKDVIDATGKIIDNVHYSREEEGELVSERWKSDNTSDDWLSKKTRPIIILFLTLMFVVLAYLDSAEVFTVKETFVKVFEFLLTTVYIAYFGSRGYEKIEKIRNRRERKRKRD